MFKIDWRSSFGYGDFISGLGYAYNSSVKFNTKVDITFYWDHQSDYKHSEDDPETIAERMLAVKETMLDNGKVNVSTQFNTKLNYRYKNNLYPYHYLHGVWHSNIPLQNSNRVVVWTSRHNTYFPGYSKDPAYDHWDSIISMLQNVGYEVIEVTYRTPINKIIELIHSCDFGIGYDGMIHQLFKYTWKPLIVIAERIDLNKLLIPHASLCSSYQDFISQDLFFLINKSKKKAKEIQKLHNEWIHQYEDPTKHQLYNSPQY